MTDQKTLDALNREILGLHVLLAAAIKQTGGDHIEVPADVLQDLNEGLALNFKQTDTGFRISVVDKSEIPTDENDESVVE